MKTELNFHFVSYGELISFREIYDFSDGNLLIPTVFARHHGEYRCRLQSPCNDRISASGYLEVTCM